MKMMEQANDKALRESVVKQLDWAPEIASHDIGVSVKDGAVSLTGYVHTYAEKVAAERAAKSVYGVLAIANDIEVKAAGRTDPEIARDIVDAMKYDVRVPDDRVQITVQQGFVTLDGAVDWNYQRQAAESRARNAGGVRGVTNKIEVRSKVSTTEVKTKIQEALRRHAELEARRIDVSVEDGGVVLDGNVRSWFEKDEAARAAWAAPGVSRVINNLAVIP